MPKSFQEAFNEWKADDRYKIGDDIGWEFADVKEADPTPAGSSSTTQKDGPAHSA
jgi:hypothetical protein